MKSIINIPSFECFFLLVAKFLSMFWLLIFLRAFAIVPMVVQINAESFPNVGEFWLSLPFSSFIDLYNLLTKLFSGRFVHLIKLISNFTHGNDFLKFCSRFYTSAHTKQCETTFHHSTPSVSKQHFTKHVNQLSC